jgi:ribosomal protein S18 acetylase RimI-like enzyme
MSDSLTVKTATPAEWEPALRLVFQHVREEERQARIANAQALFERREIDPEGLAIASRGSRLVGAMVSTLLPGATGLVWPPQAVPGPEHQAVEDRLVEYALAWVRERGAKMAQAIVLPAEIHQAEPLMRHGFRHLTALWYLRHDLSYPPEGSGGRDARPGLEIRYQPYPACDPSLFAATLVQTYEGTLDCPEVNGIRTVEEIVIGHQGQGKHDPNRWWLVWRGRTPVGVLLLTGMPEWQALDIAYLGVVPEARRQGLGREMTRWALAQARTAAVCWLTLAVDRRNRPAWDMYLAAGFVPHEEREVFVAFW